MRAAASVAGHRWEVAGWLELDGGTENISRGEAEEGSILATFIGHLDYRIILRTLSGIATGIVAKRH